MANDESPVGVEVRATEGERRLRADARKNRACLLAAAETAFAERGISVPIDDIARTAGVGVGTLYRHFPTKEALFAAVVASRLENLRDESRRLLESEDPGAAFLRFAELLNEEVRAKHDLADALVEAGIDIKAEMADVMDEMNANVEQLVDRAQKAGTLRGDLSAKEVFGLCVGSCMAAQHQGLDPDAQRRMFAVVLDGLRPSASPASG